MEVVKTFKNLDLIKVANDQYCVRRRYKSFLLRRDKADFYILDRNGTDFTAPELFAPVTIAHKERAELVFNVNALKQGML